MFELWRNALAAYRLPQLRILQRSRSREYGERRKERLITGTGRYRLPHQKAAFFILYKSVRGVIRPATPLS